MKRLFFIILCLFLFPEFLSHAEEASPVVAGSGGSFTNLGNTGSASTQVPISVPPGRNGIAPNLNIVYNSSRGYGWLGLGWALEMGEISRATKRGTDYNGDDFVFLKDGSSSELVRRGDWCANCYGMKIEGAFSKFYRNPATGGWEVTTKDGIKYYYGSSSSSRQNNPYDTGSSNQVFKWHLDRVQDTNGNFMTISYADVAGFVILDRIDYTGNADNAGQVRLAPSNYIKFNRENSLLKSVETFAGDNLASRYEFLYVSSTGSQRQLLSKIVQYGNDGVTTMPPMEFSYQTAANEFTAAVQLPPNLGPVVAFGDFNGDGRADIATTDASNKNVLVYLSNGNWFISAGTCFTTGTQNSPAVTVTDLITGDFDGDGKADIIIKLKYDYFDGSTEKYIALRSNGTTFSNTMPLPQMLSGELVAQTPIAAGDFNGDGRVDIAVVAPASGAVGGSGGIDIYLSKESGFEYAGQWDNDVNRTIKRIYTGDFNGDGKSDIFMQSVWGDGGDETTVFYSKGYGFTPLALDTYCQVIPGMMGLCTADAYVTGDFNGDGLVDIGIARGRWISVHNSTGGFFDVAKSTGLGDNNGSVTRLLSGDIEGNGKADILYAVRPVGDGWEQWGGAAYSTGLIPDLLILAKNGIGGTTTISYMPSIPDTSMPVTVQTISSITVDDGYGNVSTTNYTYSGGNLDIGDREFRGFAYVKATNGIGTTTETWFNQDDTFKGLPGAQQIRDAQGNLYAQAVYTYDSTSPYSNVTFPFLTRKDESVYDGTSTAKQAATSFEYDPYGNIKRKYSWGDVSVSGDERDEHIVYEPYDTANWILVLPKQAYTLAADGTAAAQSWYSYDPKGNLLTKKAWLDGINDPVITYSYTDYGNQMTVTDPLNSTATFGYDATYTYATSTTTYSNGGAVEHRATATYDARYGKPLTKTDPNSATTNYQYDEFGRLKKVINPGDGWGLSWGTVSYIYQNFGTPGSQRVTTYNTTEGDASKSAPTCPAGGAYNVTTNKCEADTAPGVTLLGVISFDPGNDRLIRATLTGSGGTLVLRNDYGESYNGCDGGCGNAYSTTNTLSFANVAVSGSVIFDIGNSALSTVTLNPAGSTIVFKSSYSGEIGGSSSSSLSFGAVTALSGSSNFDPGNNRLLTVTLSGAGNTLVIRKDYGDSNSCDGSCGNSASTTDTIGFEPALVCPTGYSLSGSLCVATPSCPAGQVLDGATDLCEIRTFIWKQAYFDGLGREIKTRAEGPGNKVIAREHVYNNMGQVAYASAPYFETLETPKWAAFTYDPIGRVTVVTNPDNTVVSKSYLRGQVTLVDGNGHVKMEETDVYGRKIKVNEYTGIYPNHVLSATTTYKYDVLGNLIEVTDAKNNKTTMTYDPLSRKIAMNDPDMGTWSYEYDANGNLVAQTDAKLQRIVFTYDELNRILKKDYPTGTDVNYTYDDPNVAYSKGRLSKVTDASGAVRYYYDKEGQVIKTLRAIGGIPYITKTTYDVAGRVTSIEYPDGETATYEYDNGGNLVSIPGYVTYSGFNALGQPSTITYANGVTTVHQFYPENSRLFSITTNGPNQVGLQNVSYTYDNKGNIKTITDYLDGNRNQTFTYDHLNRLTEANSPVYGILGWQYDTIGNMTYNSRVGTYTYGAKPHAVVQTGANSYNYDENGNMDNRAGRTITYDFDNRAKAISGSGGTVTSVYDYTGQRIKKTAPSGITYYIGKHYECKDSVCTKYIFAGGTRVASVTGGSTYYYHTDHLGSSSVITNSAGNLVEAIFYYPYGEVRSNTGSVNVKHKFTGQEEDPESGLYYYGARYYDPQLGRFISADSIVPSTFLPQALNRYSYCMNNPLYYVDPSGHKSIVFLAAAFIIGGVVGVLQWHNWSELFVGAFWNVIGSVIGVGLVNNIFGPNLLGFMLGGMAAGGIISSGTGGNPLMGMLMGGAGGIVAWGISSAIQGARAESGKETQGNSSSASAKNDGTCLQVAHEQLPTSASEARELTDATRNGDLTYKSVPDPEGAKWAQIDAKAKTPDTGCHKCFDFFQGKENCIKFDDVTLHIRNYSADGLMKYHYDGYNIKTDFWRHIWFDTIRYLPQDLGLVGGN